jgi:hypothetical protein
MSGSMEPGPELLRLAHPHFNHTRLSLDVNHLHRLFGDDAHPGAVHFFVFPDRNEFGLP